MTADAALRARLGRLAEGLVETASLMDQARHDLGRPGARSSCTLAEHQLGVAAMFDGVADTLAHLAIGDPA